LLNNGKTSASQSIEQKEFKQPPNSRNSEKKLVEESTIKKQTVVEQRSDLKQQSSLGVVKESRETKVSFLSRDIPSTSNGVKPIKSVDFEKT
jgi:hypothetical protein